MIRNCLTNSVSRSPFWRRNLLRSLFAAPTLLFLLSAGGRAFAGSATWSLNPAGSSWFTATNWTPPTVPNGPGDTATFDVSNVTGIFVSEAITIDVNGIVFNAGASPFTLTVTSDVNSYEQIFKISGVGITNNSGIIQNFVTQYEESA